MFDTLPSNIKEVMTWDWARFEPYFEDLKVREIDEDTVADWLANWTQLSDLLLERQFRLYVDTTLHTTDEKIEERYNAFLENIYPHWQAAEQELKDKLLDSGIEPDGYELPLRKMRTQRLIYSKDNLKLEVKERQVASEYNKLLGAQTVEWEGEEYTITQLTPLSQQLDRADREKLWRQASDRVLEDRQAINDIWGRLLDIRQQMTRNVGMSDHREYSWHKRLRFDYTPEDSKTFHRAIEEVAVPAARRVYERRAQQMGVEALRPWDISLNVMRTTDLVVSPNGGQPEQPFSDAAELSSRMSTVFHKVDPQLGAYFDTMRNENLLNLDNYKGKAPGAYCTTFPTTRRPFIFQNAVGVPGDVDTLLHESGHAFHVFERVDLPYSHQRNSPMEFNEVASMAMEELGSPYLLEDEGGFYSADAFKRTRTTHLEEILIFWPYMAVVDAWQHWAYTHPADAADPANCDAMWLELWNRYIQGVDWSGLDEEAMTGWHRKLHIYRYPLYYVEYGLARLGAIQVWANALEDQAQAVADYRAALALGGTVGLSDLFERAGGRFGFDTDILKEAVDLVETEIDKLQTL